MKRLFKKQEIKLLTGSNILTDYPELSDVLQKHPDYTDQNLPELSESLQNTIRYEYRRIVRAASLEWSAIFDDPQYPYLIVGQSPDHKCCELCGNSQCYDLYPIGNQNRSSILYVGSSCIKKFGINGKEAIENVNRERIRIRKYTKLNQAFPGIVQRFLATSSSEAENTELLIPNPLYTDTIECFKKIRELCDQFQSLEFDETHLPVIKAHISAELARYDEYCKNIQQFIETNRGNWLIPTRSAITHLKHRRNGGKITKIRNDYSMLNEKTLYIIEEPEFVRANVLPRVQRIISGHPIQVADLSALSSETSYDILVSGYYVKQIGTRVRPHLLLSHTHFVKQYGLNVFNGMRIESLYSILSMCRTTEDTPYSPMLRNAEKRLSFYKIRLVALDEDQDNLYVRFNLQWARVPFKSSFQRDLPFFVAPERFNPVFFQELSKKQEYYITLEDWQSISGKSSIRKRLELFDGAHIHNR